MCSKVTFDMSLVGLLRLPRVSVGMRSASYYHASSYVEARDGRFSSVGVYRATALLKFSYCSHSSGV